MNTPHQRGGNINSAQLSSAVQAWGFQWMRCVLGGPCYACCPREGISEWQDVHTLITGVTRIAPPNHSSGSLV